MINEGKDTVHYELGPGKVLCMQTDPMVTSDRHRVTCKRCLRKLKKGLKQRDLSGSVKTSSRRHEEMPVDKKPKVVHLLKPKKLRNEGMTIKEVREIVRSALDESWILDREDRNRMAKLRALTDRPIEYLDKAGGENIAHARVKGIDGEFLWEPATKRWELVQLKPN